MLSKKEIDEVLDLLSNNAVESVTVRLVTERTYGEPNGTEAPEPEKPIVSSLPGWEHPGYCPKSNYLRKLSPRHKAFIVQCLEDGWSQQDLAAKLGIRANVVSRVWTKHQKSSVTSGGTG